MIQNSSATSGAIGRGDGEPVLAQTGTKKSVVFQTIGRAGAVLVVIGAMLSPVAASAAPAQPAKVSTVAAPAALPNPGATRASALAFFRSDHVPAPDPGWT